MLNKLKVGESRPLYMYLTLSFCDTRISPLVINKGLFYYLKLSKPMTKLCFIMIIGPAAH